MNGRLVKEIHATDKETRIDVRNLVSGIYIIKSNSVSGISIGKFVVDR